jgi:hypothetical protein
VSTEQFFAEQVWAPIVSPKCVPCHNPQGAAKSSGLVYRSSSEAGFLDANLAVLRDVASLEKDGTSILLLKPTAQMAHGGGQVIAKDGPEYQALATLVQKLGQADACATDVASFFKGVELGDPVRTLRKASLAIAGRLPTDVEAKAVADGGLAALDGVLDGLMKEDAFYERLKTTYNDLLLTDRYLGGEQAVSLVDALPGYQPFWYKHRRRARTPCSTTARPTASRSSRCWPPARTRPWRASRSSSSRTWSETIGRRASGTRRCHTTSSRRPSSGSPSASRPTRASRSRRSSRCTRA